MDRRLRAPESVVFRTFATETIALNLDAGSFHGLNPTAGRMVELIQAHPSPSSALPAMAEEFGLPEDELRPMVAQLVDQMISRGLLVSA
jgi:hypothetical protein